jgi:hypothetical protein
MVSKRELERYIKDIPPKPETVQRVLKAIDKGELREAGEIALEDPILTKYLENLVNRPVYGFRNRVKNPSQIFSILGTTGSSEAVYHYLLSLLRPKKWHIFNLNSKMFQDLQATLGYYWRKVLKHEGIEKDNSIAQAIALLPATIVVCDSVFNKSIGELQLIEGSSELDFNLLLKEVTGISLFDMIIFVGKYWSFSPTALHIIKASSSKNDSKDSKIIRLGQFMHLILFYVLSKREYVSSGLNSFIKFDIDYVMPVYEEFQELLGDEL